MIAAIIIFAYSFLLFYYYGFAVIKGLLNLLGVNQSEKLSIPTLTLVGVAVVTILASALNLVMPLGLVFSIFLFIGGIIIYFLMHPFKQVDTYRRPASVWILLILAVLTVLEIATHRPNVSDTALYHAQTIRWFETYPAVPGLGNLHHRLAFNSSWLVLNAAFSFAYLGFRSFHFMGAILLLICLFYFVEGLADFFQSRLSWSGAIKVLCIPLSFHLFSSEVSSPAYDMPVSLLIFVIVILWIEMIEEGSEFGGRAVAVFLLSIFLLTIKLSALPILGFPVWILIKQFRNNSWRRVAILFSLALLTTAPWMIRSLILSGYLFFPLSQIDLFSFDWKVPLEQVESVRNGIVGFARLPGRDWQTALTMTPSQWVPVWFENLTFNQQGIFTLALFSPILLWLARFVSPIAISKQYVYGYCILYAGVIFWFLSAPDIRFGYGYVAGVCVFVMSLFLIALFHKIGPNLKLPTYVTCLALIVFQGYTLSHSLELSTIRERIFLPSDYIRSRADACDISNGTVYCRVEGGQCNYDKFPCIPSPRPYVEMRGPTFQDGFRVGSK